MAEENVSGELSQEEIASFDKEFLSGPTLFVNRYLVQNYPDGGIRITFAEQYSANPITKPIFRTAVFMHTGTAINLIHAIISMLPEGSITIASQEKLAESPIVVPTTPTIPKS